MSCLRLASSKVQPIRAHKIRFETRPGQQLLAPTYEQVDIDLGIRRARNNKEAVLKSDL